MSKAGCWACWEAGRGSLLRACVQEEADSEQGSEEATKGELRLGEELGLGMRTFVPRCEEAPVMGVGRVGA